MSEDYAEPTQWLFQYNPEWYDLEDAVKHSLRAFRNSPRRGLSALHVSVRGHLIACCKQAITAIRAPMCARKWPTRDGNTGYEMPS